MHPRISHSIRVVLSLVILLLVGTLLSPPDMNAAVAGVGVSPASLSFGNQAVSTSSSPQTVTLTNSLSTAVSISSITSFGQLFADQHMWDDACVRRKLFDQRGIHSDCGRHPYRDADREG